MTYVLMTSLHSSLPAILIAAFISGLECLHIEKLIVPAAVPASPDSPVILDCDYTLEHSSSEGLVVKWFFNDYPNPVYQWIFGRRPQELGVLKRRLSLEYQASQDPKEMYRAMKIQSPSKELSGVYRCHVSTFEDEAWDQRRMIVYTPAKSLDISQTTRGDDVILRCVGIGVYPEPNITISNSHRTMNFPVTVETISKEGLYNIEAMISFKRKDLPKPTTFDCVLNVPEANYTLRKSIDYYPAEELTTEAQLQKFWSVDTSLPTHYDPDIFFFKGEANEGPPSISSCCLTLLMALFVIHL